MTHSRTGGRFCAFLRSRPPPPVWARSTHHVVRTRAAPKLKTRCPALDRSAISAQTRWRSPAQPKLTRTFLLPRRFEQRVSPYSRRVR
jgi:hypothetical protein